MMEQNSRRRLILMIMAIGAGAALIAAIKYAADWYLDYRQEKQLLIGTKMSLTANLNG